MHRCPKRQAKCFVGRSEKYVMVLIPVGNLFQCMFLCVKNARFPWGCKRNSFVSNPIYLRLYETLNGVFVLFVCSILSLISDLVMMTSDPLMFVFPSVSCWRLWTIGGMMLLHSLNLMLIHLLNSLKNCRIWFASGTGACQVRYSVLYIMYSHKMLSVVWYSLWWSGQ